MDLILYPYQRPEKQSMDSKPTKAYHTDTERIDLSLFLSTLSYTYLMYK
jgi:hypothetical protein